MKPDDRELDDEIRGHLALEVKERIERGEDPEAARLAALREFGYAPDVRESMRRVWYSRWLDDYQSQIEAHLEAGRRDDTVRGDVDAERAAGDFVLHGSGLIFRWTIDPENFDLAGRLRGWRDRLQAELGASAP